MEKLPNLPVGQQYFKSIRKGKAIYVDKTQYIYDLCEPIDKGYFLSRPRRFGKSLTLDTINELFSGNRGLFEGLWIEDKWDRPIVDYIDPYNLTMANKQRDILKDFFSILKNASNNIRFLFITGVSKFARVIRKRFAYKLEETEVSNLILESFRLEEFDALDVNSLLLQTGYLTIKEITPSGKFILNYPNQEVRQAFGQFLLSEYTQTPVTVPYGPNILDALTHNNLPEAIKIINDLIKSVPDQNYIKDQEKFFHAIIHLIFTMVGSDPRSEMHTGIGRMDTVIILPHRIFLFEFKMNETPEEAIQCIRDRQYADSLRHLNKPITGVGVVFSVEKKGVADWDKAEL